VDGSFLFRLFFHLITGPGPRAGSDGPADKRARRARDRATDDGAGHGTSRTAGRRAGLVVTLGRLAGCRATSRADGATDQGARRTRDRAAHEGATDGAGAGPDGLVAVLPVLWERVVAQVTILAQISISIVVRHSSIPFLFDGRTSHRPLEPVVLVRVPTIHWPGVRDRHQEAAGRCESRAWARS
jgi:hypothetical protein